MYQYVSIIGRFGREPEMRGEACKLNVAVSRRRKDGEESTTWFRVTAWGKLAEICNQYCHKGMLVQVAGEIQTSRYTDKNGVERDAWEVNARDVVFLSKKGESHG